MAWYIILLIWFKEKANPAQEVIYTQEGTMISSDALTSYT